MDEVLLSKSLLGDAVNETAALRHRVAELEICLQGILETAPAEPPPPPKESEAFGMRRTREAIEKAVREAATLPAEERSKKLKALRLKWHPDKHEVLRCDVLHPGRID
jgi:hypothetical protein